MKSISPLLSKRRAPDKSLDPTLELALTESGSLVNVRCTLAVALAKTRDKREKRNFMVLMDFVLVGKSKRTNMRNSEDRSYCCKKHKQASCFSHLAYVSLCCFRVRQSVRSTVKFRQKFCASLANRTAGFADGRCLARGVCSCIAEGVISLTALMQLT